MTKKISRVRLGDVATVRCGLVLSRKQSPTPTNARYHLLNLRSINADGCVEMAMLDEYYAVESLSSEYLSQVGDVIVRLTAPYTAILVDEETAGMVVSSNFVIIRPNPRQLISGYLAWLLNTRKGLARAQRRVTELEAEVAELRAFRENALRFRAALGEDKTVRSSILARAIREQEASLAALRELETLTEDPPAPKDGSGAAVPPPLA